MYLDLFEVFVFWLLEYSFFKCSGWKLLEVRASNSPIAGLKVCIFTGLVLMAVVHSWSCFLGCHWSSSKPAAAEWWDPGLAVLSRLESA